MKRWRGRKTKAWDSLRAKLKPKFESAGITTCEAKFPHNCWWSIGLSFAHSKKRADIQGEELSEVALLCPDAHQIAEAKPKPEMYELILEIIASRERQP